MNKKKVAANFILLFTAFIWGTGFVAQRVGMEYIGPLTFIAIRFFLATIMLLCVIWLSKMKAKITGNPSKLLDTEEKKAVSQKDRRIFIVAGFSCGGILFCGAYMQQLGLVFTTAAKASFITALYIIIVPLLGLFLKHHIGIKCWIGVASGSVGLYLLCITEAFTMAKGDFIVVIGAFFWACHVLVIDLFLPMIDGVKLAAFQFAVCSAIAGIAMIIFETPLLDAILACAFPIAYAGIVCAGIGFTLQIIGQKYTSPTVASLLMSTEAVFGAVAGFIILNEKMTNRELTGCAFMLAAIVLSQLPEKQKEVLYENL
ncbi:MAG: DMT family transporter [Anaerovoracaceae bacterium]